MIFKQSMKSIIRTPKKTILFFFLLIVLTIFLNIGAGMYESARNMLLDADETFTSLVELEYLGDSEGDEVNFYKNMNADLVNFDFNKLENHPNVKAVDMEKTAWAFIDGNTIKRNNTPLSNYAMVKISSITKYKDDPYMGIVNELLFGKKVRENAFIMINDMDELGMQLNYNFTKDHEYLIIGKIANEKSPTLILSPGIPELMENIPSIIDLTEYPDFFLSDEGKQILKLQEAMEVVDNSLPVTTVSSLEASAPYYFNEILIKEGRIFDPSEYHEGSNKVILISKALSDFYHVKEGEMLSLKLHYDKEGIGLSDFLTASNFNYEASYEVVGIFENKEDNKYIIYMPGPSWLEQELHTTTLARYIVKNGSGTEFIEDNRTSLLPNMEFTLSDQGYDEAVKPINALKSNAVMIIVLGSLSGFAILILFSYLYVIKQKDTLKTMLSIGTGKRRGMKYILYGSVTLVFCASSIGSIISYSFLNKITLVLFETMKDSFGTDLRYSERNIGLQMNYLPQVRMNLGIPVIVIMTIVLFSFILLFSFTYSVLREDKQISLRKSNKKQTIFSPRKTKEKKMMFGRVRPITLKFALISLTRSPGRSFIVPLISLFLSFFIIFLGVISTKQQQKLDTVYEHIPVTAYITSLKNETREIGGLNLQNDIYRLLEPKYSYRMHLDMELYTDYTMNGEYTSLKAEEERSKILTGSEYFEEMHLYSAMHYEYMGISKTKDGEVDEELSQVPNIRVHQNTYGYDWFLNKINKMPKLAYADDLRYTPDFFNESEPKVEFLEGYSYSSLRFRENIAIISQNFATTCGIENGDTIRITPWINFDEAAVCSVIDVKIVGIYNKKWRTDTIYIPWIMSYDHNYYVDYAYPFGSEDSNKGEIWNEVLTRRVRAATFTLKNTEDLSRFRDYLEKEGYSQFGKLRDNRRSIVIQDKRLVETVQNLKNHIRLIDTIKPIMLILFGIIGFAISYILIKHRTDELAIMRSIGAKKRQVFFSFFLEQLILFLIGLIPSVAYAVIFLNNVVLYGVSLVYLIFCYLMGTALALIIMNKAKILDVLFSNE